MEHSFGFLTLVNQTRPFVREVTVEEARQHLSKNPTAVLIDVREDQEWQQGHATQAVHLGRGILERDLERQFPDPEREIILYCGGGYRSVLAADAARKMGYRNVFSLKGGYRALLDAHWPMSALAA
jgi:rhodanese-related sulfurtransferase